MTICYSERYLLIQLKNIYESLLSSHVLVCVCVIMLYLMESRGGLAIGLIAQGAEKTFESKKWAALCIFNSY